MGEAIAKLFTLVVDSLTPRSVRVLLIFSVALLGYVVSVHNNRLDAVDAAEKQHQIDMAELRANLKAMVQRADEGNAELRAIRQWLMARPTSGR